jgi:hypothetical protein
MAESPSIRGWKKLAIRAFFGGAGFAVAIAIIAVAALWYQRQKYFASTRSVFFFVG